MATGFRPSVGPQNLKIFNFNYYELNKQQKWHNKIAILEKKFSNWNTLGCFTSIKSENITFVHILKFLKNFFFFPPHFLRNSFVLRINPRTQKLLEIFSALQCAYLELSTGKIKNLEVFLVNTSRVSFCTAMAPAFRSRLAQSNLKIFARFYF